MINDTPMTLTGNVCDEPVMRITRSGHSVTNLRVASTPRRYDREKEKWVDGQTLFVSVACWRQLAEHVANSVHKGEPVIVTGRYVSQTYEVNEQLRYTQVLEATSLGHDLSRGTAQFRKVTRSERDSVPVDENGVPADESRAWLSALEAEPTAAGTDPEETEREAEPELANAG
jgi:single-strand DNA-binding protein